MSHPTHSSICVTAAASTQGAAPGQQGGSARGARRVAPAVIADRIPQAHHAHGLGRTHALSSLRARPAVAQRRASMPPRLTC